MRKGGERSQGAQGLGAKGKGTRERGPMIRQEAQEEAKVEGEKTRNNIEHNTNPKKIKKRIKKKIKNKKKEEKKYQLTRRLGFLCPQLLIRLASDSSTLVELGILGSSAKTSHESILRTSRMGCLVLVVSMLISTKYFIFLYFVQR